MKLLVKLWIQFKILSVMALLGIFTILALPFLALVLLTRVFVLIFARLFKPELGSYVEAEHSMFALEDPRKAPLNVVLTAVLDGNLPTARIRELFQEKVWSLKDPKNGRLLYDGLRKSWVPFLGFAFWKEDKDFDIRNHVKDYENEKYSNKEVGEKELWRIIEELYGKPWVKDRSPWEFLLLRNFSYDGRGNNHTVVMIRFDHVLSDGYSIMELVKRLTASPFQLPNIKFGTKKLSLWMKLGLLLKIPYDTAANVVTGFASPRLSVTREDQVLMDVSEKVSVDVIKSIKNHFDVYYVTVVYAAISGAIERTLRKLGGQVPENLSSMFVVPRPGHPRRGICIHASAVLGEWPVTCSSPVERLMRIQKNMEKLSKSTVALAYIIGVNVVGFLPMRMRKVLSDIFMDKGVSLAISNFPVTVAKDYAEGHELLDLISGLYPWSSVGLTCTVAGVNNNQRFTFTVKKSLVKENPEFGRLLGAHLQEELQALISSMV